MANDSDFEVIEDDEDSYATFMSRKLAERNRKKLENKKKAAPSLLPRLESKKSPPKRPINDDNFDDLLLDDDSLDNSRECGEFSIEERIKKARDEMQKEFHVESAKIGSKPSNFYPSVIADVLNLVKDCKETSPDEPVVLDDEVEEVVPFLYFRVQDIEMEGDISKHELKVSHPFGPIFKNFAEKWGCEPHQVMLQFNDKDILEKDTPLSINIDRELVPQFVAFKNLSSNKKAARPANSIQLKFQMAGVKKPIKIFVQKSMNMKEVVALVSAELKKDVQKMIFDHEEVDEKETVEGLCLEDDDCFDVYV